MDDGKVYVGMDLGTSDGDKSVIVIPDDADIFEAQGKIIVMNKGVRQEFPKGTIVFSQSGLKNAQCWEHPNTSGGIE